MSGYQPSSGRGRGTGKAGPKESVPSGPPPVPDLGFPPTASNSGGAWDSGAWAPPPLQPRPGLGPRGTQTSSPQGPPAPLSLGFPVTASNSRADPFSDAPVHPPTSPTFDSKKSPPRYPFASTGASDLANTSLFSSANVPGAAIEQILQQDTNLSDTPSKTNKDTIEELQRQVKYAVDDAKLLMEFQQREKAVRGDKTQEQRKKELRTAAQPWIGAGLNFRGHRRPGLYLEDGTRSPERPAKRPNNRSQPKAPSETAPAGSGIKTTSSSSAGIKETTGGRGGSRKATIKDSSSTSTGAGTKGTKAGASTTGGGRKSLQGSKQRKKVKTGGRPIKGPGKSPLGQAPITMADLGLPDLPTGTGSGSGSGSNPGPPVPIPSGTGGAPWQARDDLFQAEVMDAAGITPASEGETVARLPTLPSSIDYNTENWER